MDYYEPARVKGDVLVFDVTKSKLLGGFTFDVENSDKINFRSHSTRDKSFKADLNINLKRHINKEFIRLSPCVGDITNINF